MGRGAYDTTEASNSGSSAAQGALNAHHVARAQAEREADMKALAEQDDRLKKQKKSRGIMAAKRAAKAEADGATPNTSAKPSGDKDASV